jgi:hypothetical protein
LAEQEACCEGNMKSHGECGLGMYFVLIIEHPVALQTRLLNNDGLIHLSPFPSATISFIHQGAS